jgi:hypothetical protein
MARSRIALDGLPHSEIPGSKPVCGSPGLIAAYHVLHRRPAPRHPPHALSSLTTTFTLLETLMVGTYRCPSTNSFGSSVVNEPGQIARSAARRRHRPSIKLAFDTAPLAPASVILEWWSWPGSNRRPPPCKGGALPVELQPQELRSEVVGLSGFEPLTSRLSAVRSSQLSYRPVVDEGP